MNFQYEVDGCVETHDPAMPSTTFCPFMPGQAVNTLSVPVEKTLRHRSASMNSMRITDFKTRNPESKFVTPRPAPSMPSQNPTLRRLGSSPLLQQSSTNRSVSPAPAWKRFFGRKVNSRDGERGRSPQREPESTAGFVDESLDRCTTPSDGTRTRDISPESLRRFLSDDLPPRPDSNMSQRPAVIIPDDIVEENDDDDNFASSAVSETQTYPTRLSPPPFKRSPSTETLDSVSGTQLTSRPVVPYSRRQGVHVAPTLAPAAALPKLETQDQTQGPPSSFFVSPVTPQVTEEDVPTFYDSSDDEDGAVSSNTSDYISFQLNTLNSSLNGSFECYSLPEEQGKRSKILEPQPTYAKNFLGSPIDNNLDDFVNELGWMVDVIGTKRN